MRFKPYVVGLCFFASNAFAEQDMVVSVTELREYCHSPLTQCVSWAQLLVCFLTLVGLIVAVVCHCRIVKQNTTELKANHDLNMRLAAMDAVNKTLSHNEAYNMRSQFEMYYINRSPIPYEEIEKKKDDVRSYLNALEALAVGIQQNVFDENTVKEAYENVFRIVPVVFSEYIDRIRRTTHTSKCYTSILWAAERWGAHQSPSPRTPSSIERNS